MLCAQNVMVLMAYTTDIDTCFFTLVVSDVIIIFILYFSPIVSIADYSILECFPSDFF